jgi:hypothetical protein
VAAHIEYDRIELIFPALADPTPYDKKAQERINVGYNANM